MQEQVHLGQHVGQRLGLAAEDALLLQDLHIRHGLALLFQVAVGFGQEAARAAGRVENDFAEAGIGDFDHEADDRPGRVELARIAGRVPHLAEHGFVEMAEGMDFFRRVEVDAVDQIDDIAEQIAGNHAVLDAAEDVGDHVAAAIAVLPLQGPEVGEQPRPLLAVRPHGLVVVDELDEFVAGDAVLLGGPIPPAIGRFDGRAVLLAADCRPRFLDLLQVVKELEEHDPGEHRQAVEVAVEPLVLPHDVAGRLDEAAELLGRGLGCFRFLVALAWVAWFYRTPTCLPRG